MTGAVLSHSSPPGHPKGRTHRALTPSGGPAGWSMERTPPPVLVSSTHIRLHQFAVCFDDLQPVNISPDPKDRWPIFSSEGWDLAHIISPHI